MFYVKNKPQKYNIHLAYILQGGHVVSIATNSLGGTSGINSNRRFGNDCSCHAEMGCIKNIKRCNREKFFKKKFIMYSLAYKITIKSGIILECELTSAKPCRSCVLTLAKYNIKKIWHSTSDRALEYLDINKTVSITSEISSGSVMNVNINNLYDHYDLPTFSQIIDGTKTIEIFPRKGMILCIVESDILVLQYTKNKKKYCKKIIVKNISVGTQFQKLIRNLPNKKKYMLNPFIRSDDKLIKMYKHMLKKKKTKTYVMLKFESIQ